MEMGYNNLLILVLKHSLSYCSAILVTEYCEHISGIRKKEYYGISTQQFSVLSLWVYITNDDRLYLTTVIAG